MRIEELFGKTITNFYAIFGQEQGWLDTADCFIEIDNNLIIGFPYGFDKEVRIRGLDPEAENLFNYTKAIHGLAIQDFLWYDDDSEKGFLLLSNGSLITEIMMSPHGTGLAGINYYKSVEELIKSKGDDLKKLSTSR